MQIVGSVLTIAASGQRARIGLSNDIVAHKALTNAYQVAMTNRKTIDSEECKRSVDILGYADSLNGTILAVAW